MKKLTRKSLEELAKIMPMINENTQRGFVGGGIGSEDDPYTEHEYDVMCASGTWKGGYVSGWGYTSEDVEITGGGSYDVNAAINYLTSHANSSSTGYCAQYVRKALEAGGLSTDGRPGSACDYDTWLQSVGFEVVPVSGVYNPQAGDIVVFEAIEGHRYGHIAMYNEEDWISDFVQRDMYGGTAYRNDPDAVYTILRYK